MDPTTVVILMLIALIVMVVIGIHIGISLGITALVGTWMMFGAYELAAGQVGSIEIGTAQPGAGETRMAEVAPGQAGAAEIDGTQIAAGQIGEGEVCAHAIRSFCQPAPVPLQDGRQGGRGHFRRPFRNLSQTV